MTMPFKKQSIALASIFALVLSLVPVPSQGMQLNDVQGTPYLTAFNYLTEQNVVQGYDDGSGRPYAPINRVEVLKVLIALQDKYQDRLQWYQRNVPPIPLFSDVDQTEWYVPYLETAFEHKMITGYPNGTFKPGNHITVEEAYAMLVRSFGITQNQALKQSHYIQNAPGHWYTPIINTAIERNLVSARERLYLGSAITRGQFFDALYRLDYSLANGQNSFIDPNPVVVQNPNPVPPRAGGTSSTASVPSYNQGGGGTATPTTNSGDLQYLSSKPFAITIPSVGIYDLAIVRPANYDPDGLLEPLSRGVGHLFSFPGGDGKIMVYGHSSSYPWDTSEYTKIFRKINEANAGDKIYVTYNNQLYVYKVTFEQTIQASDTSPFNDDGTGEELILYTCWPPDSIQQRYLVHATPV